MKLCWSAQGFVEGERDGAVERSRSKVNHVAYVLPNQTYRIVKGSWCSSAEDCIHLQDLFSVTLDSIFIYAYFIFGKDL